MGLDHGLIKDGEMVITWRKDNHIHNYFTKRLKNCENSGESDDFKIDLLYSLMAAARYLIYVVNTRPDDFIREAEEILPTKEGFFFGDTSYDEYYLSSLKELIKELKPLLKSENYNAKFRYWSWW